VNANRNSTIKTKCRLHHADFLDFGRNAMRPAVALAGARQWPMVDFRGAREADYPIFKLAKNYCYVK
jgi:hypothetical protein